jgi:type II secretory pathway pseudopilin PulG
MKVVKRRIIGRRQNTPSVTTAKAVSGVNRPGPVADAFSMCSGSMPVRSDHPRAPWPRLRDAMALRAICSYKLQRLKPRAIGASAFTLIELLIIVSVLGILAAIVAPMISNSSDQARIEAIASNVSQIRADIIYHAGVADVPLSAGGSPTMVQAAWFRGGQLPEHAWTGAPMVVQVVNGAANAVYPAVKVFNPMIAGATSAWYNAINGAFCALVPPDDTDAKTLARFNAANKVTATALNQTTN